MTHDQATALDSFHPVIRQWFLGRFAAPTEPQQQGWPHIAAREHTLIAAPTGSGKTLTAFLAAIDRLLKEAIRGELTDEIRVVYVSPLRALSNDMHRNLEVPLAEITALALADSPDMLPIRAGLRTGDTPASKRASLLRKPPHILVTTPESLYLLLTSVKGRERLRNVETVIVDEIHALVRDKRGSHLALTLERLAALCPKPLQRIGLSATQRPIDEMARFLIGTTPPWVPRGSPPEPRAETLRDEETRQGDKETRRQGEEESGLLVSRSPCLPFSLLNRRLSPQASQRFDAANAGCVASSTFWSPARPRSGNRGAGQRPGGSLHARAMG